MTRMKSPPIFGNASKITLNKWSTGEGRYRLGDTREEAIRAVLGDRVKIMATKEYIPSMTDRIVERFHPERIILFGSQARGDVGVDSDVDLLVVFPQVPNKRQTCIEIRRALADFPVCKDIFVTTPDEIERRGDIVGDILRPALREGKVLYERGRSS